MEKVGLYSIISFRILYDCNHRTPGYHTKVEVSYRDHFLSHHLELLRGPPRKLLWHQNNTKKMIFIFLGQKPGCAEFFSPKSLFLP